MKALFLDRDGVVNLDTGYTHKVSELVLVDGITHLIKFFEVLSYKILVVSNQSGIGRVTMVSMNGMNLTVLLVSG